MLVGVSLAGGRNRGGATSGLVGGALLGDLNRGDPTSNPVDDAIACNSTVGDPRASGSPATDVDLTTSAKMTSNATAVTPVDRNAE